MTFPSLPRSFRRCRGITMVEVLLSAAIFSLMVVAVIPLFTNTSRGFNSMQAGNLMNSAGQESVNRVLNRLKEGRRIFDRGETYWDSLPLMVRSSVLTGSQLPLIQQNVSLATAPASGAGNALYFASLGPSVSTTVARVDTYIFNLYYLVQGASPYAGGMRRLELWEWRTVPYADMTSLQLLPVAQQAQVIGWLISRSPPITVAWDPTKPASSAFYTLSGTTATLVAVHTLQAAPSQQPPLYRDPNPQNVIENLRFGSGMHLRSGFNYSISNNTATTAAHPVPRFAIASGLFPSGFEALVAGPASSRQVFIRLVLMAHGAFKGDLRREFSVLANVRDVY
jgi:type II secretory pathway pseudopilin PulG